MGEMLQVGVCDSCRFPQEEAGDRDGLRFSRLYHED